MTDFSIVSINYNIKLIRITLKFSLIKLLKFEVSYQFLMMKIICIQVHSIPEEVSPGLTKVI
jgi:hypothetical protein